VRAVDLVARIGGASFAVWVEPLPEEALPILALRLQRCVHAATAGEAGPAVSARVGWARPKAGDDAIALTRRARTAARRTLLSATG